MKPFIKWVGGKRKLLPIIKEIIPKKFNVYHEPFLGGGALFFDLLPQRSYLSDINENLINTYIAVRNKSDLVVLELLSRQNDEDSYYKIRNINFNRQFLEQIAADFIYLNKTGFNGLYRVNKNGKFNVPYGRHSNPKICDELRLRNASRVLRSSNLIAQDFRKSFEYVEKGDLVYIDPPYIPLTKTSNFTSYSSDGFGLNEQISLRDHAQKLKDKGAFVIISNSSSPITYSLYETAGFTIKEVMLPRMINSKGNSRGDVKELLIYG